MLQNSITQLTEQYIKKGFFPSCVVSVFTGQENLCRMAFGNAAVDSVFDVASVTKIATSTQILLLIDEGKLSLTDKILSFFPEASTYSVVSDRLKDVTLYQLLTHTSGIVDWYPFYAAQGSFFHVLETALTRYPAVEGMVYSDMNFMLLGMVISKVMHLDLEACVDTLLAKPLGASQLGYCPDRSLPLVPSSYGNPIEEDMCQERNIPYSQWRPHVPILGEVNDGNAHYYSHDVAGHAGIFADVASYEKLCQMYLNTDSPLLIRAQETQVSDRGLGLQTGPMYPKGCGHTGFTGTAIYFSKALNIGAIAFTNRLFYPERNLNPTNEYRRGLFEIVAAFGQSNK